MNTAKNEVFIGLLFSGWMILWSSGIKLWGSGSTGGGFFLVGVQGRGWWAYFQLVGGLSPEEKQRKQRELKPV